MIIETIKTKIASLDRDVTIRLMLPNGYYENNRRYPVLYINDGQDVFRDEHTFWNAESLRYENYYQLFGRFLPQIILVAIESPESHAERTAQYSPYTSDFDVPQGSTFESHINGLGDLYLDWMTKELKPMLDGRYRTMTQPEFTGICGYSTGGLNAVYAALKYPNVFHRMIAMSSAVYIWMDNLRPTLEEQGYDHLKYCYIDYGTNEFGRMTTKEQFIEGAEILQEYFTSKMPDPNSLLIQVFPDAIHSQREWRYRFPDAVRWIYQDIY